MAQNDVVVILGGAGFIGGALRDAIRNHVKEVRVVSRRVEPHEDGNVRYLRGDVVDAQRMSEVIEGATVVYQLTLEGKWTDGAKNVADACVKHGVRRFIFASTSDGLNLSKPGVIYETDAPDPHPEWRNEYSRGKVESEKLLLGYMQQYGLGVVIMRPCLVVGPGGRLLHGGVGRWTAPTIMIAWGDGKNKMPFVLVQDVAAALALGLDAPGIEGKAFNLAGDVYLSAREFVGLIAERSKRNFQCYPRQLRLYALKNMLQAKLKGLIQRKKIEYPTLYDARSAGMITFIDNGQSKKLLGWQPNASLDVFVREAIDPYLDPIHPDDFRLQVR